MMQIHLFQQWLRAFYAKNYWLIKTLDVGGNPIGRKNPCSEESRGELTIV
jgi:hypothetical protein